MPTSKQFKDFVLEQLKELTSITCKQMMGEFLLYYNGVLFGGLYDNRLLIKKTSSNKKYSLAESVPYKRAKPMLMIENIDDTKYLCEVIKTTYFDLQKKT